MSTRIAILTSPSKIMPFKGNRANFRDLLKAAKMTGVRAYVVTTAHIANFEEQREWHGYTYDFKKRSWVQAQFLKPHVVYNRIPHRRDELKPSVNSLIQRLEKYATIAFFNPRFFNKSQLAKWLQSTDTMKSHIPRTQMLKNHATLQSMLQQFDHLFLKPIHGKAGAGVMKISRIQAQQWVVKRQIGNRILTKQFNQSEALWRYLKQKMRRRAYIIQQWIRCLKVNGAPFDLRVLLQKNERGKWSVTGIGARVAGSANRLTTHVPRGGYIASPLVLLKKSIGEIKAHQVLKETGLFAIKAAQQIEQQSAQLLGEMSMDIGIDEQQKAWFFEANARPMKFDEPKIRKRSLRKWVRYCRYLAKHWSSMP